MALALLQAPPVGVAGFEPATTPTPKVCATGLRYTPIAAKIHIASDCPATGNSAWYPPEHRQNTGSAKRCDTENNADACVG